MDRPKSIQYKIKTLFRPALFLIGGFILISWLLFTPPGILGKADAVGYAVCHRIDSRSFHIGVRQLPLCVRCTGQYIGAVIGLAFLAIFAKRRSGMPPSRVIGVMIFLFLLYAIDGLNSYFYLPPFLVMFPNMPHLYEPSNTLRLFTGTGMGLVISMLIYPAFLGSIQIDPDPRPSVSNLKTCFIILALGIMVDLLILTESIYVLLPVGLISAGGVIILLTMVYTVLLLRIYRKENQFTRLSQISWYAAGGFIITIAQISLFDIFRFIITGSWSSFI
jgi:uncharacterized membrane protein